MSKNKNVLYFTKNINDAKRIYSCDIKNKIEQEFTVLSDKIFTKKDIKNNIELFAKANYIFSTWGIEYLTCDEIKKYLPNLEAVFYSAGSVQDFAMPYIENGIRVFSAYRANAVPVIEFTYAQIILASKGYFGAVKKAKINRYEGFKYSNQCGGMYATKIGILGVGSIGLGVAEKLQNNDVELYYYDPFLPEDVAKKLNLKQASLKEIFSQCDIITNHLANKDELVGILNGELFNLMKPYATFINTGRGRQVDEKGLCKALKKVNTRTALLDVTYPEPPRIFSKIRRLKNVILTPHIAGSNGREVQRMAEYMLEEAKNLEQNKELKNEITKEMLKTMA